MMLTAPRHEEILARLKAEGRISAMETAKALQVSDETIRRDLKELEGKGLLRRIHGGAVLPRLDQEQPLSEREKLYPRAKARIAEIAERLLHDGASVFLDTGTTTLALARRLTAIRNLTVTTNSLDIAMLLGRQPGRRVQVTPGTFRPNDNALIGYEAVEYVRRFFYDFALMGIAACDLEQGWMDYAEDESLLRRTLLKQSHRQIILVDHSKFGRRAYARTFGLDELKHVVTDRDPPAAFGQAFAARGVTVSFG